MIQAGRDEVGSAGARDCGSARRRNKRNVEALHVEAVQYEVGIACARDCGNACSARLRICAAE